MINFIVSSPAIILEIRFFITRLYLPLLYPPLSLKQQKSLMKVFCFFILTTLFPSCSPNLAFSEIASIWHLCSFLTSKTTQYSYQSYPVKSYAPPSLESSKCSPSVSQSPQDAPTLALTTFRPPGYLLPPSAPVTLF